MAYDYARMGRIPVDPKVVDRISRSSAMSAEQGPGFMSGWGGSSGYQVFSRLPVKQRLTYAAILEGYSDKSQISVVTGLTEKEVDEGLSGLRKRGLVSEEEQMGV